MQIHQIKLSDIKPFAKNNKKHPARQVKIIANSIKEFGFKNPIIIDTNNEIIAWHGRIKCINRDLDLSIITNGK